MSQEEGVHLQKGMNFRLGGRHTVILMSLRKGAPYADRIENDGQVLIYEGHDIPRRVNGPDPKSMDQPQFNAGGTPTQNGLFFDAAKKFNRNPTTNPEIVKVYEKIKNGIWVYNGKFRLVDAWIEPSGNRKVFKFRLELTADESVPNPAFDIEHERLIPSAIKLDVWKRDAGKCIQCGSADNLHFDHIIPYSKGGSSLVAENIQILCARHNLSKSDRIQ